jgi:hypothetical protein
MEAISFPSHDLDFIIHSFQLSRMVGRVTMVQDSIAIPFKHLSKLHYFTILKDSE